MDLLADIGENPVLELTAVLLLMAIWGGAILAIDHWVLSGHLWPSVQAEMPRGKPGRDDVRALSRRVLAATTTIPIIFTTGGTCRQPQPARREPHRQRCFIGRAGKLRALAPPYPHRPRPHISGCFGGRTKRKECAGYWRSPAPAASHRRRSTSLTHRQRGRDMC
jgi:hypothetical protein